MCSLLFVCCACHSDRITTDKTGLVDAPLGFSLNSTRVPSTKVDVSKITELLSTELNPRFRGLTSVRVLPFFTGIGNMVQASSQSNGYVLDLADISADFSQEKVVLGENTYHDGLLAASHAHVYGGSAAALPEGTTAVLAYGRAPTYHVGTVIEDKLLNGSLMEEGWDWQPDHHFAADIRFTPESIYTKDAAEAASSIAEVLSLVAQTTLSKPFVYELNGKYEGAGELFIRLPWSKEDLGDEPLKNLFTNLINGRKPFAGSTNTLLGILKEIKQSLASAPKNSDASEYTYNSYTALDPDNAYAPITMKQLYQELRSAVDGALDDGISSLENASHFPQDFGLPCGSALVKWNGASFDPVPYSLDGYLPVARFCYMPPLYYYVNTLVYTAYDRHVIERYGQKTWRQILDDLYTDGKIVVHESKSVALEDPLQYACGMLVGTVKADAANLLDKENKPVSVGNHFPLTGIIVGGQYQQHFDFTPVTDDGDDTLQEEYYLFDGNVLGPCLDVTPSDPFRTLVLPTPKDKEVYFLLEFKNNSDTPFTGHDGVVYKDCHFYLAGKLTPPTEADREAGLDRAFMSDHYTTVTCTVNSLKEAYLAIPQLGDPSLALGVQTQVNWYYSSSYVVLD